ncbi:beta-lactamase/transpeptidase-like protein [Annulohypoxylon maeteangense]|uniref:beta-lactamase/transpeptidase-like protein n=1 Tax=Annulohypoxylon maeteangense TaxID=1927788 RepID=UPI0020086505|nr:beta-lactamase/transpeptidase-like protein [Annulohypoxylon maeteangense]KAI0887715.1 beta-lactamase/transpeptidase-like protein [Annulohypoxylon maeteangense]
MISRYDLLANVFVTLAASNVALAALNGHCPPLGPVLPAPTNPAAHQSVQLAIHNITDAFHNLTAELNYTGISIAVKSIHEDSPLLELHHTPAVLNPNGTAVIDSQTVYRLGSISKIFAVLSLLQQSQVKMDDVITKYVPELLELEGEIDEISDITTVRWNEVTLGALASHMSGIGTDLVNDLASIPTDWTQVGLPKLNESSKTGCAGVLGLPPCNRTEFFRDFGKRHPVYAPFTNPVYSNVASVILGFAVEAITNTTYENYVRQSIFGPLSMTNTTIFTGPKENSWGFIPVNETWWGSSLGYEDMAGGFYSNTLDLLSFGTGLLKHTVLDSVKTRKWMKPLTSTSSSGLLLGGPWEIIRSNTVTKDKRLIEFYCKAGNLASYNNELCLIPDYDLVITILSGGPQSNADLVDLTLSRIVQGLLPAIEDASKAEAIPKFGGTYADATTNSTITLSLDDAPGFSVYDWVIRDVDIIKNYGRFAALSSSPTDRAVSVRLYPTNLGSQCHTAWRAVFDIGTPEQLAAKESNLFWSDASCHTWGTMDRLTYGFRSMDEFVFELSSNGSAQSVNLRTFKVELERKL